MYEGCAVLALSNDHIMSFGDCFLHDYTMLNGHFSVLSVTSWHLIFSSLCMGGNFSSTFLKVFFVLGDESGKTFSVTNVDDKEPMRTNGFP